MLWTDRSPLWLVWIFAPTASGHIFFFFKKRGQAGPCVTYSVSCEWKTSRSGILCSCRLVVFNKLLQLESASSHEVRASRYTDRSAGDLHGISDLLIAGAMLYRLLQQKICIYFFKVNLAFKPFWNHCAVTSPTVPNPRSWLPSLLQRKSSSNSSMQNPVGTFDKL